MNIVALINSYKQSESRTGCCVNNDGSGCVQSSNGDCSVSVRRQLSSIRSLGSSSAVFLMHVFLLIQRGIEVCNLFSAIAVDLDESYRVW